MFNTVYKTTNNQNGKIYMGVHVTSDSDDGYLGSGKVITKAIEKYGVESFSKEILFMARSEPIAYWIENMLVDEEFVQRQDTYNLKVGGQGGWGHIDRTGMRHSDETIQKIKEARKLQSPISSESKEKMKYNHWSKKDPEAHRDFMRKINKGVHKSQEHKDNISKTLSDRELSEKTRDLMSKRSQGEKNSQFGTMWVYNLEEKLSKKIKKEELPEYKKLGWLKGRKMKFKALV